MDPNNVQNEVFHTVLKIKSFKNAITASNFSQLSTDQVKWVQWVLSASYILDKI